MALNWIAVLNEATDWQSQDDARNWLCALVGRSPNVKQQDIADFLRALDFMREQLTHLHFGEPIEYRWFDDELKQISMTLDPDLQLSMTPELDLKQISMTPEPDLKISMTPEPDLKQISMTPEADLQKSGDEMEKLPVFRARPRGNSDADILRSIRDTLIVQCAQFLGDSIQSGSQLSVARCEGLVKQGAYPEARVSALKPEMEAKWLSEIELLKEVQTHAAKGIQRCEDFFVATSKAKFCSDACRFNTFQIGKQLREPDYLAQKQKRYRSRKKQS
ncbi:MAG TPA: hypothetical protein V6D17_24790 [Candidatus Obscuribacterales bacterium]